MNAAARPALWELGQIRTILAAGRQTGLIQIAPAEGAAFIPHFILTLALRRHGTKLRFDSARKRSP